MIQTQSIHFFRQKKTPENKFKCPFFRTLRDHNVAITIKSFFELMMYMHHSQTHWSRDMNVNYRDLCVDLSKSPDIKPHFSASFSIVNSIFSPLCFSYSSLASCRNFLAT